MGRWEIWTGRAGGAGSTAGAGFGSWGDWEAALGADWEEWEAGGEVLGTGTRGGDRRRMLAAGRSRGRVWGRVAVRAAGR